MKNKKFNVNQNAIDDEKSVIGKNLNFEGAEAFNLLRTNLFFSFADDKKCHIIGMTSPMPGAGKSLCSINLTYAIAKAGQRVLLIDGDLRLPTVQKKLKLSGEYGLSNVLTGKSTPEEVITVCNKYMDIMIAGTIPPRPSELLGSEKMNEILRELEKDYDYIIVDLPPVMVVPDAIVISKYIDGLAVVVHKDSDEKDALDDTLRQLNLANAKVIGLIFNSGMDKRKKKANAYSKK